MPLRREKGWLSLLKLVSNLVCGHWILELLSSSFPWSGLFDLLRYEHRHRETISKPAVRGCKAAMGNYLGSSLKSIDLSG